MSCRASILALGLILAACAGDPPETPAVETERWVAHELHTVAAFRDVFFLDERHGWIVGGGHAVEGGIVGETSDGGLTWKFTSGIVRPSRRASSFHLNAVRFLDRKTGFVVGDGGQILRTVDGGEHWHGLRAGAVWAHLSDLQFVDNRHGWAIGEGGVVRTIDGGESWRRTGDSIRGRAIHFVDPQRGWIVGRSGSISRSVDGGVSWTSTNGPPSSGRPDLWGVDFVSPNDGWAVGEQGTILHSADGGASWQRQSSRVTDTLMDVDFVDRLRGWAVGFERGTGTSVVLRTTDGGSIWSEQDRIRSEATRALFVLDESNAWALGAQQRRSRNDASQKLLRYETAAID